MELVNRNQSKRYDIVVVGGGLSGVCAAIAAARNGARVALVQNRPMLGGNASSEIRMHVCSANCQLVKKNVNETGILLELLLENKRLNPHFNFNLWDMVLIHKVQKTEGLDLFLNTQMDEVECRDNKIRSIRCFQSTTEIRYTFTADLFLDCTGHATLGFFAGAEYRMGSEGKDEFGEDDAQETENGNLMGNTLLFKAVDRGEPVPFLRPDWAKVFTEEQLRNRVHVSFSGVLDGDKVIDTKNGAPKKGLPELYTKDYGYWWIELGGDSGDIIGKSEEIRDELTASLWGIWDHVKNGGDHGAGNFDLLWCGIVPGTRDSRRLVGDYLLNEQDILSNRVFDDAVAYGGWPMDVHTPGGLRDLDKKPSRVINFEGVYTIPYRSYYSGNIENLMMAGRNISATKMGMSSSRIMGTCAVGGQAAGTAAALCIRHGCSPRALGQKYIRELQDQLIRDDCWIPGFSYGAGDDLAQKAAVTAATEKADSPAGKVQNGHTRNTEDTVNAWRSEGLGEGKSKLVLSWDTPQALDELRIVFDPDLSCEMSISLSGKKQAQQIKTLPPVLTKDYLVECFCGNESVCRIPVTDNRSRLAIHPLRGISCDRVEITVLSTYGADYATVFEVYAFGARDPQSF